MRSHDYRMPQSWFGALAPIVILIGAVSLILVAIHVWGG